MYNDLACLDQYFGDSWAINIKDKWSSWFHKNQSTITTTTNPATTTNSPTTLGTTPQPISNKTTEVISDLRLQDATDGLEFFKIYNDFMLSKLASKLSQNAHERRMLQSAQNQGENTLSPELLNPTQSPLVPDFTKFNENDIQVLRELDSCLKNKKTSSNLDDNVPIINTDGMVNDDVNARRGIYERYLYKN